MIFKRATLADGRLLEYREWPLFTCYRILRPWFWLPVRFKRYIQTFAVQRRIDGGAWCFVRIPR